MRPFLFSTFFLLTSFSYSALGQLKHTKYYSSRNGFCSQSIILDSNGYFFHEWGCEGRSNISFGKYKLGRNNIINFHFFPFDSITPIKEVVQLKSVGGKDSIVTITFYDRFGQTLNTNFGIRVADTSNTIHEVWTDEEGQIQVNRFVFKNVGLIQLLTIYGEAPGIPITGNSLNVYINLPKLFLENPELKLDKPLKLNLQLKQDGLYNAKSKAVVYKLN
jgi:hypothetical protein